jgi:hypothetical protein
MHQYWGRRGEWASNINSYTAAVFLLHPGEWNTILHLAAEKYGQTIYFTKFNSKSPMEKVYMHWSTCAVLVLSWFQYANSSTHNIGERGVWLSAILFWPSTQFRIPM